MDQESSGGARPGRSAATPSSAEASASETGPLEIERRRVQRRTLAVVVICQLLGGAGIAAAVTVGALLAQQMLGSDSFAGLPIGLVTLGSALAAYLVGWSTQRGGRRIGLAAGFAVGGIGAFGVVAAAVSGSVPLLFISLFIHGAGTATNLQARYAGADLALSNRRGTAISVALVSTTVGAVAGPNLVEPLGGLATTLGVPALGGPFLLSGVAYLAAGLALFGLLRPDPLLLARQIQALEPDTMTSSTGSARSHPVRAPEPGVGAYVGATIMVLTQISMVAIMTMTPVHLRAHHHGLGAVGLVIGIHTGAMFLPSLVTGVLVDKIGRTPVAIAAGITLLFAGVTAATSPGDSLGLLIVALAMLGLGWNLGLISGTALVVDATVPENRPRTQGSIDVLIALGGAGAGAMSGVIMSATDYASLSLGGGVLALLFIPVLLWARRRHGGPSA